MSYEEVVTCFFWYRYGYTGYDPAYKKGSPGTGLVYHGLRDLFEDGRYEVFDLTDGAGGRRRS